VRKICLATCHQLPEPDVDESVLLEACLSAGLDAEYAGWDDPSVDWSRFDSVVLRSTWNYYLDPEAFTAWVDRVAGVCTLWNPADVILGNLDKHYLADFQRRGIPIVPTRFVDGSSPVPLATLVDEEAWDDFVVKPTISAASYMTRRFSRGELAEAQAYLDSILAKRDAMVQKFLPRVAQGGEVNLVVIDGALTHGVTKHPRFHDGVESVSEEAIQPNAAQRAFVERVLAVAPHDLLFARVDLMELAEGDWALSELELIEPSLFFLQSPPALAKFVEALALVSSRSAG
jgi:hypothetical protein